MDQRHLPDPSQFGLQGRPGGTLESVMNGSITPMVEPNPLFQLPPIREFMFDQMAPDSVAMSRRPSEASYTSSGCSDYNLSRSSSPNTITFLEPGYDSSSPVNRIAMHTAHFSPRLAPSTRTPAKAIRQKRTDRKLYSRLRNEVEGALPKFSKGNGEAGRRYDHNVQLSCQQGVLLDICPDLPQMAAQGKDSQGNNRKPGWTLLKSNNRCEDVNGDRDANGKIIRPLAYNKNNIYASTYQVMLDSTSVIDATSAWHHNLETEADSLWRRDPSNEEMKAWIRKIANSDGAAQISAASGRRGAIDFKPPFPPKYRPML